MEKVKGDQITGILKPVTDYELEFNGKGQIWNCGQVGVKVQARQ